jgi:hypothetical protein
LIFLSGGIGFFAWQVLDILRTNSHWIAYPLAIIVTFTWLLFSLSTILWLTLVAKGTFRPKDDLEYEDIMYVDVEPEEYEPENK